MTEEFAVDIIEVVRLLVVLLASAAALVLTPMLVYFIVQANSAMRRERRWLLYLWGPFAYFDRQNFPADKQVTRVRLIKTLLALCMALTAAVLLYPAMP